MNTLQTSNAFSSPAVALSYYTLSYAVFYILTIIIISLVVSCEIYWQRKHHTEHASTTTKRSPSPIQENNDNNVSKMLELTTSVSPGSNKSINEEKEEEEEEVLDMILIDTTSMKSGTATNTTITTNTHSTLTTSDNISPKGNNRLKYGGFSNTLSNTVNTVTTTSSINNDITQEEEEEEEEKYIGLKDIRDMRMENASSNVSNVNIMERKQRENEETQTENDRVIMQKYKDNNFCYIWFYEILWKKKSIYMALIAHTLDTTSCLSVIILWIYSSIINHNDDLLFMGIWLLFIFILYRIVSSIMIYNVTHKYLDVLLQFLFDLKLFITAYNSHSRNHPSIPMRWIRRIQIILQSTPNAIFCLVFLIRDGDQFDFIAKDLIVILSFLTSLYSIIIRLIADDSFSVNLYMNNYKNWGYYQRLLFRIFELVLRILTLTMIWITLGGMIFAIFIIIEIIIILFLQYFDKTNNKDLFFHYFVVINLSNFASKSKKTLIKRMVFRSCQTFILLIIIISFSSIKSKCNDNLENIEIYGSISISFCIDYKYRRQIYIAHSFLPILAFFLWITTPLLFALIYPYILNDDKHHDSRNLLDIVNLYDDTEIETLLDWIEFGADTQIINNKTLINDDTKGYNLLQIAAKKGKLQHLMVLLASGSIDINFHEEIEKRTALQIATINNKLKCMVLLLKSGCYVNDIDKYNRTALHYGAIFGGVDSINLLLKYNANPFIKDNEGKDAISLAKDHSNNEVYKFLLSKCKKMNDHHYDKEINQFVLQETAL